ncbi:G-protein coupled receptor GRL101-like [Antedon mediterranea]|uniref:G-protein coupled receptor GRL101-like n=1 Tax=Antedon mediterranea TaxID=105859 RepID=UPI003AF88FC4
MGCVWEFQLRLEGNQISTLPARAFNGLSALTDLILGWASFRDMLNFEMGFFLCRSFRSSTKQASIRKQLPFGRLQFARAEKMASKTIILCIIHHLRRLEGNQIHTLEANAFSGLESLTELRLNGHKISTLPANAFNGLTALTTLNLDNNAITTIDPEAFSFVVSSLSILKLRGNKLKVYRDRTFQQFTNLKELYSEYSSLCCLVGAIDVCEPSDAFASCEDLLKNELLRVLMMIIGLSSVIGNVVVIVSRKFKKDNDINNVNKVQTTLITNLAVSDLLMAVYLIIIASVDIHYRGRYGKVSRVWRNSVLCSFAGAISTLSGQCSVFTLMLLSVDRAINIVNPFSTKRLNRTKCRIIISFGWLFWIVLSFLPVIANELNLSYFGDNYYGKESVCLALPLTRSRWPGWEYAVAIFVAFNGVGFFVIVLSYLTIFLSVKRSGATVNRRQRRKEQLKMARKLGLIVFTDFCCWAPIIVMAIGSETGWMTIPDDIYVWAATFIIPINSSVNPYLYTIAYMFKCKVRQPAPVQIPLNTL